MSRRTICFLVDIASSYIMSGGRLSVVDSFINPNWVPGACMKLKSGIAELLLQAMGPKALLLLHHCPDSRHTGIRLLDMYL